MPTACREYLSLHATEDQVANQRLIGRIIAALKPVIDPEKIGVLAMALMSKKAIENQRLNPEEVHKASEGKLPVIFVNVTFDTADLTAAALAEWERTFDLRLLGELVTDGSP